MRTLLVASLLLLFSVPVLAAPAPASATRAVPVTLTPAQARTAVQALNDPQRRAQLIDTLQAIAAAGALGTPASAPQVAAPAAAAPAPAAASGPVAKVREALESNGLASQLARDGAHWAGKVVGALQRSLGALLDTASVHAWWQTLLHNPHRRAELGGILLALLGVLLPALAVEWLARRLLRRALLALAAYRSIDPRELFLDETPADANDAPGSPADAATRDVAGVPAAAAAAAASAASAAPATPAPPTAQDSATRDAAAQAQASVRGRLHAVRHWSLLRRLPRAALRMLIHFVPLAVFVAAASVLMPLLTTEGTPQGHALDAIVDIYALSRTIVIVAGFFLQPDAPQLRLLQMSNRWAQFLQRWIVMIVGVAGVGSALADTAASLGLSEPARLAVMKVIALATHVMISLMIFKCRKPVAARIRARCAASPSLAVFGNALADSWASVSIFLVMALWFVWALDVRNGYHTLTHLGGISVAVLIGARLGSIVVFGALARVFDVRDDAGGTSLVHQHAYRYYPLLRGIVSWTVGIATVLALLEVWGVNVAALFEHGTLGRRLTSALVTIAVAAVVALFVWETTNLAAERRLRRWTDAGDLVRAARLRTLLPMLRTALFVVIALIVVLTGLSELGVNIGPLLAGASIFGVALGFGSQKLVQDFITGIFLLMENAMQVGDWVTLAGVSGTVEYLSIRTVRLRGGDGSLYTVPFSSVSTVNNTNRGLGNASVKVSIAYGEDIDRAIATLTEIGAALRADPKYQNAILSDFAYWGVDSVDGAALTLVGQIQCRDSGRWGVQREFNRRIADQFRARGIAFANPQRTVMVPGDAAGVALRPEAREGAAAGDAAPGAAGRAESAE
jgi:small-conductance mechanosensitive channel